jgi:hypothetical protein
MAAAKRSPRDIIQAMNYLERNVAEIDTIGEIAKVVMAAELSYRDPRAFAGRDLVQEILDSQQPDGRFGATTEVLNHALAMMALRTVGEEPTGSEVEWLLAAQCEDGGWQFDQPAGPNDDEHCYDGSENDFFGSETDATAYAVIALRGEKTWNSTDPLNPFSFFETRRDPVKNGWGYDMQYPITSSNSTALVIEAYRTHHKNVPNGAVRALVKLQHRLCGHKAGAFSFTYENVDGKWQRQAPDVGATIGGVLGLVQRPYDPSPINKLPPEAGSC